MSLKSNFSNIHLNSPLTPPRNLIILHRRTSLIREYRVFRRRRLKTNRIFVVRNQLGPLQFENLFENLVSQFPSVNSLDLIAPALGFASGVSLYLSRLKLNHNSEVSDIGEWILFTSPTPFNHFVMLRCPSISFEGSELLEDANKKLVKEDMHFVRLNSGRIQVRDSDGRDCLLEEKLVYQRVCVSTDDGGVISLDWPANLDLTEEHGLDTTLLLIPGTAEGSMDRNIRSFVCECLKRGCFPVVMNPRGCAGSPLTTARLFTAADSDDICTAIQFIDRARPRTTLIGVGWGYGANMLTIIWQKLDRKHLLRLPHA
uniref:AB hydrolase-1 domain-containing protein n=1 Tax=Davidia involucrata TaxID=16924 RepID=A0A5B7B8P0_DAVIN